MIKDNLLARYHHLISLHSNGPKTTHEVQNCFEDLSRQWLESYTNGVTYHAKTEYDQLRILVDAWQDSDGSLLRRGRAWIDPWVREQDPDGVECDGEEMDG